MRNIPDTLEWCQYFIFACKDGDDLVPFGCLASVGLTGWVSWDFWQALSYLFSS